MHDPDVVEYNDLSPRWFVMGHSDAMKRMIEAKGVRILALHLVSS
jgi:hypothetical protein